MKLTKFLFLLALTLILSISFFVNSYDNASAKTPCGAGPVCVSFDCSVCGPFDSETACCNCTASEDQPGYAETDGCGGTSSGGTTAPPPDPVPSTDPVTGETVWVDPYVPPPPPPPPDAGCTITFTPSELNMKITNTAVVTANVTYQNWKDGIEWDFPHGNKNLLALSNGTFSPVGNAAFKVKGNTGTATHTFTPAALGDPVVLFGITLLPNTNSSTYTAQVLNVSTGSGGAVTKKVVCSKNLTVNFTNGVTPSPSPTPTPTPTPTPSVSPSPDIPICGDTVCSGFESCLNCATDCGVCATGTAWWQVSGGHAYAGSQSGDAFFSSIPAPETCLSPDCLAALFIPDLSDSVASYGFPFTGGGTVVANGSINEDNTFAVGTRFNRYTENYAYFARNANMGSSLTDDFTGQETNALEPTTNKDFYYHAGDLTIQTPWEVSNGETRIVFIDGNLTITDPGDVDRMLTVSEGSFLGFIVSGNITIDSNVGNADLDALTPNIEGLFVADGTLTVESLGAGNGDDRFVGAGTFVGWSGVDLQRDFEDGGSGGTFNLDTPAETFIYRPDLVRNIPDILTRPHSIWQERN